MYRADDVAAINGGSQSQVEVDLVAREQLQVTNERLAILEMEIYRFRQEQSLQDPIVAESSISRPWPLDLPSALAENSRLSHFVDQQRRRILDLEVQVRFLTTSASSQPATGSHAGFVIAGSSLGSGSSGWVLTPSLGSLETSSTAAAAATAAAPDAGVDLGSDPPMLIVPWEEHWAVCVLCDDHVRGLFTHSWNLVCNVLGTSTFDEDGIPDQSELYPRLQQEGPGWTGHHVERIVAIGGARPGLAALGVGSNMKKRQRAARLALAATALCLSTPQDHGAMDLTGDPVADQAFFSFVQRVRLALDTAARERM